MKPAIEAYTNGNVIGLAVGAVLVLPSGREVPLAEAGPAWRDDPEHDVEDAAEACRTAAEAVAERLAVREADVRAKRARDAVAAAPEPRLPVARASSRRGAIARHEAASGRGRSKYEAGPATISAAECASRAEHLIAMAGELPDRAAEFAQGVTGTLQGIAATARRGTVTLRMERALVGIEDGIEAWEGGR